MNALFALRDLARELAQVTLVDETALDREVVAISSVVVRTIAQLETLQQLGDPDPVLEWDELEHTKVLESTRGAPVVSDLAFAGALELRRVARELDAARAGDDRLVAAETARRKLRRAIKATLDAAEIGGVEVGEHQGADLASGLAVRRLYARFRRDLRRPDAETQECVLAAVRYAGVALATMVTSPDYADVRASDRAVLRRLRERALEWARGSREIATGLELIEDLWTCSDLLREINQRQELRHHDRELARSLRVGPGDDPKAWLAALQPLAGRDDRLDALLEAPETGGIIDCLETIAR